MMMGTQATPDRLFYDFCLDDHVPADHLLRQIDRFLDLASVRRELSGHYSTIGRPSIDPELMIRMLIVGYCFAIRSERRLCEEVPLNLACRCGSVGWAWTARCRIIRPSHVTATADFGGATSCAISLRASCAGAWRRGWSAAKASQWTPA